MYAIDIIYRNNVTVQIVSDGKYSIVGFILDALDKHECGEFPFNEMKVHALVSGPHPAKAHADEIDLMEEPVWNQSRGLAVTTEEQPVKFSVKEQKPPSD